MPVEFNGYDDFKDNSFFYELNNLSNFLMQLPAIKTSNRRLYTNEKWQFKTQAENYLRFLEEGK